MVPDPKYLYRGVAILSRQSAWDVRTIPKFPGHRMIEWFKRLWNAKHPKRKFIYRDPGSRQSFDGNIVGEIGVYWTVWIRRLGPMCLLNTYRLQELFTIRSGQKGP